MRPVTFGSCFGWLHEGTNQRGVVMCSPVGFEELGVHRAWRDLAQDITKLGFNTLRFDYDGINDSLGDEQDPDRIRIWIENVVDAVKFLRESCGISKVALVGLRLGSTFAALAASALGDIDELVLLSPVITGRNYIRELRLVADSWWAADSPTVRKEHTRDYLDIIGDRLYAPTLDALGKIDLRQTALPVKKLLIADPGNRPDIAKFSVNMATSGIAVDQIPFIGIDEFLRDSVLSKTPQVVFDKVCEWLDRNVLPQSSTHNKIEVKQAEFITDAFKETSIFFGPNDRLFGILTEPMDLYLEYPSVIILNTGPNHHVGNGRLAVLLSRHLASLGITTLRFDISGIGDSDAVPGRNNPLYSLDTLEDVNYAIDVLQSMANQKGSIILGLCSGAFLGFHSAVNLQHICGAIMVNLQRFIWKEGTSLQVGGKSSKRSTKFYMKASIRKSTWIRFLKGDVDFINTVITLGSRQLRIIQSNLIGSKGNVSDSTGQVRKWVRKLSEQGIEIRFWYSTDDPGLSELREFFGANGRLLAAMPHVKVELIEDADHSLNSYRARMQFISMFEAYLREGFGTTT